MLNQPLISSLIKIKGIRKRLLLLNEDLHFAEPNVGLGPLMSTAVGRGESFSTQAVAQALPCTQRLMLPLACHFLLSLTAAFGLTLTHGIRCSQLSQCQFHPVEDKCPKVQLNKTITGLLVFLLLNQ